MSSQYASHLRVSNLYMCKTEEHLFGAVGEGMEEKRSFAPPYWTYVNMH